MQDVQMLQLEINRNIKFLPLESLTMVAKYIASLYKSTRSEEAELETPSVAQVHNGNHQIVMEEDSHNPVMDWEAWLAESNKLTEKILARRNGKFVDTNAIWDSVEADWEERDNRIFSS